MIHSYVILPLNNNHLLIINVLSIESFIANKAPLLCFVFEFLIQLWRKLLEILETGGMHQLVPRNALQVCSGMFSEPPLISKMNKTTYFPVFLHISNTWNIFAEKALTHSFYDSVKCLFYHFASTRVRYIENKWK